MCQVKCQDPACLFPTALCLRPHLSGSKHACPFTGVWGWGGWSFMRSQGLPGGFGLGWATSILKGEGARKDAVFPPPSLPSSC